MKFDLTKVQFSNNDIRLGIKVPEYLTEDLAYFLGFHVGDGYMKIEKRKYKVDYRMHYDGHHINEFLWYNDFIKPLIKNLFNKDIDVRKTTRGTVRIFFRSKGILTFLNDCCGLSLSPKTNIDIPQVIKNSNNKIKAKFLKGLMDTDFSLVFKKRTYPVIELTTGSRPLYNSLKVLLGDFRFKFYSTIRETERKGTKIWAHHIQINGKENLQKWMNEIGFSSYNHLTRYLVWKEIGFLNPGTDINERIKILNDKGIDIPKSLDALDRDRTGNLAVNSRVLHR